MKPKCPRCKQGWMFQQYDRQFCYACSHSIWYFNMEKKGGK